MKNHFRVVNDGIDVYQLIFNIPQCDIIKIYKLSFSLTVDLLKTLGKLSVKLTSHFNGLFTRLIWQDKPTTGFNMDSIRNSIWNSIEDFKIHSGVS